MAALLIALAASGCIRKVRNVDAPPPVVARKATLEELNGLLEQFTRVQSLKAKVTLQLTYLNDDRTKENELLDVNGFIVAERPESIRVQAQMPVVRQKAFDMVSHDGVFRVYLAFKHRFFEGSTAVETQSEKRSENIRPQHILEPLLLAPPGSEGIVAVDVVTEGRTPYYVIQELVESEGRYTIARKLWFNRTNLELDRIEIRNKEGELATTARYRGWTAQADALFPETVVIERPIDGYTLTVKFLEPGINEPPTEGAFVLEAPDDLEVEHIQEVEGAVVEPE